MALHLVPDAPKPPETEVEKVRRRRKADPRPKQMIQCGRCGSREVIETKTGVMSRDGRTYSGGTKSLLCAGCLLQGVRTILI